MPGFQKETPIEPPIQPDAKSALGTVTFRAHVPADPAVETITLEVLDEVTGLALNPKRYEMTPSGENQFEINIPIALGSLVKYRYIRTGERTTVEYTAGGQQVRYRMAQVGGPSVVEDIVAGWTDAHYAGPTGRITGQVIDAATNTPIPSALVTAGGSQTFTASDGSFLLEGLIPGTHNLVAASLDGLFKTFQQGAVVAENATTPAPLFVEMAKLVKVTFVAQIPAGEVKGLPLRLVGSSYALGNTFADLDGGMSVIASRAPIMPSIAEDIYSLTLELPTGLDLRYKYSLGDGFWNSEHYADGSFRTRQLIVPDADLTVTDIIESWKIGAYAPVTFTVTAPSDTLPEDIVSIQFNPFGWTAPIPMWPLGNNQWLYVLNGPLDFFSELKYRYCRNDQCGVADDGSTHGLSSQGKSITLTAEGQNVQDTISAWANWSIFTNSTTIIAPEITAVGPDFVAGVEFNPNYSPVWQPYFANGLQKVKSLGANWVIFTPTWSYTRANPPVMEPVAGRDALWTDTTAAIQNASQAGLQSAIFPRLQAGMLANGIWNEAIPDAGWWETWFSSYRTFALHHADLAAQTQAAMLILGGPDVTPALPDSLLPNVEPSGVPEDAGERWQSLVTEIRGRYAGQIAWALPYPFPAAPLPEGLDQLDALYIVFNARLTEVSDPTEAELQESFATLLDTNILPVVEETVIPVILALDYPSANGAAIGCVQISDQCLPFDLLNQPTPDLPEVQVDLQEQADIYNAAFNAMITRPWINGVVSVGYYPPAALQDTSASIHGKPASDVLWYWFPKIIGQ
ncbi:MAG: glycoside hydrolase family 113 [Bellilinea sp.]